jgi:ADP-ribosyl-[dinitrogen reductase] hydrolase
MSSLDRQRGTLFGLVIGDVLGAAVEFQSPGSFPELTGYRGGGPHGLAPGEWTDDSSMAPALAASVASSGWDLNDQARRYVAWCRKGEYPVNASAAARSEP